MDFRTSSMALGIVVGLVVLGGISPVAYGANFSATMLFKTDGGATTVVTNVNGSPTAIITDDSIDLTTATDHIVVSVGTGNLINVQVNGGVPTSVPYILSSVTAVAYNEFIPCPLAGNAYIYVEKGYTQFVAPGASVPVKMRTWFNDTVSPDLSQGPIGGTYHLTTSNPFVPEDIGYYPSPGHLILIDSWVQVEGTNDWPAQSFYKNGSVTCQ